MWQQSIERVPCWTVTTIWPWIPGSPVTEHSTLNTHQIILIHKIVPHKHACWKITENLLIHQNFKFFSALRILLSNFRDCGLEKAILNFSQIMKQGFNTTMSALKILHWEGNSLASVGIPKLCSRYSDWPAGGARPNISEKCCFYVNPARH